MTSKLGEMVLYVASKSKDDPNFGATKLNKILFIADFYAYGIWGKPITEATYTRREWGPVPHELPQVKDELLSSGRATEETRNRFGRTQKRIIPAANPNLSLFDQDEIELIDQVIEECKHLNATNLSDWTHELQPWLNAEEGEKIPYETIFVLKKVPASLEDISWAERRVEELMDIDNA